MEYLNFKDQHIESMFCIRSKENPCFRFIFGKIERPRSTHGRCTN